MTDTEINIAIAEACGLFKKEPLRRTTRKGKKDHNGVVLWYCEEHHGGSATYARVPDYLNDLNAMHDAESRFLGDASAAMSYAMHLLRSCGLMVVSEYDELNVDYCWAACYATARQRAEAFLHTIGKWVD